MFLSRQNWLKAVLAAVFLTMSNAALSCAMVFPGTDWQQATPESQGVDSTKLQTAVNYISNQLTSQGSYVGGLLIIRNGYVIWQNSNSYTTYGLASVSKSFLSTGLGLMIEDGDVTLSTLAKNYDTRISSKYPSVTLRHFVTMTSGYDGQHISVHDPPYDCDPQGRCDTWDPGTPLDPLFSPGTKFRYWDEAELELGYTLGIVGGNKYYVRDLLKTHIADPIGMANFQWDDVQTTVGTIPAMNGGLRTSARDLARFGHLFLNRGNWSGQQLISASWVDQASSVQVPTSIPDDVTERAKGSGAYGYNWWLNTIRPNGQRPLPDADPSTYWASGYGTNLCFVIPAWNMVIVRTGEKPTDWTGRDAAFNSFLSLVGQSIGTSPPQAVTSLTLVNADTDQDIMQLTNGATLNLQTLPTRNLNVRANTNPSTVGSVRFGLDINPSYSTESVAPYTLAGDTSGDYNAWTPSVGSHTITATPYTGSGASGSAGTALSISFNVVDQASTTPEISGNMRQWQKLTITFTGPSSTESSSSPNPFLDYRLQVTFTGPGGQVYVVPGFFDGDGFGNGSGSKWKVHFTPDQAGTWSYSASFRQGSGIAVSTASGTSASFDGTTGSFSISGRDASAPGFLSKGRLAYDNAYYLKTLGDGKYWIKGGADSPENFLAYSGFDGTTAGPYGILTYSNHVQDWATGDPDWGSGKGKGIIGALNYLSSRNVNSIYFLPMNIGGDGQDTWPYSGTITRSGSSSNDNLHFDISKLSQWETVFDYAEKKGIHLNIVLGEGESANKNELDAAQLGTERKLLYREMIARFGHHNALQWMLCEEYDIAPAISSSIIKSWAQYIKSLDSYDHPVSVHNWNSGAWSPFLGDTNFDATSYQYYPGTLPYGDQVENLRQQAGSAGRQIPIHVDETWTTKTVDDESFSQSSYPYIAGQSYMRKNIIWPVYLSGGDIEFILDGDQTADDFRDYQNLWDYTWYARKFMESLPFWEMEPMDSLLTGEASGYSEDGQTYGKAGQAYAIYLPSASPSGSINLQGVSGTFEERWYNPRTGLYEGSPTYVTAGSTVSLGSPPRDPEQDWVVLLTGNGTTTMTVTGFELVNADTDQDIGGLYNGATLNLLSLPNINVRAETQPSTVGSVKFVLDGAESIENVMPYALAGDTSGDYNPWNPSIGMHTLTATPYSASGATGTAGTSLTLSFSVTEYHNADNNPADGCVSSIELSAFIGFWYLDSSNPTIRELIEAIGLWKRGGC